MVQGIRRAMRKHYSGEDMIRIVLDGLPGEDSIAEPQNREDVKSHQSGLVAPAACFKPPYRPGIRPVLTVGTGAIFLQ